MTAEEYVDRVFDYERLPSKMSTKSFLHLATDLFDHVQLKAKIVQACMICKTGCCNVLVHR